MTQKHQSLLPVYMAVFLDMLGVGIIIPVLAPLIISSGSFLLPIGTAFATRTMILGFLTATYPLAQFFGAPVIGVLSDRYGRKPVLLASIFGSGIGYVLFALGVVWHALPILFVSRLLDGFTGGNISVAISAIADVSTEENKTRNFGLIGMMFGLGFILGPYIGGLLSNAALVPCFSSATPFFAAAALSAINIFLVSGMFRETLRVRSTARVSPLAGIGHIARAFRMRELRAMFLVSFLIILGFNFFTQFFQVYLVGKFNFSEPQIGNLFAFTGIWIALTQGVLMRPLSRRYKPVQMLMASIPALSVALFLLLLPAQPVQLLMVMPLIAISNGIVNPSTTSIISSLADESAQGEIMGINHSFQALGMAIPPIVAGFLVSINLRFPLIVSGVVTLVAWLIFLRYVWTKHRPEPKVDFR